MFRTRRSLLTAASLALIGAAAPIASAEPWFRISFGDGWGRPRNRHVVRQPPACPPPVIVTPPVVVRRVEVVPCDLRFTAYQTGDTVIVIVNGTNTSGGFETCLTTDTNRNFSTT